MFNGNLFKNLFMIIILKALYYFHSIMKLVITINLIEHNVN